MWQDASSETSRSIDLRFTLVLESTKRNARQREVVLCPSPSAQNSAPKITAPIGAGGMGEVYRARDTKLKRDVALKVLPEAFANDPGRMLRFQREAEVLASLNHPNIAHIYGVEERALVMELVEGQTLAGPLAIDSAIQYARQIAEALEYAHERGVI